MNLATFATRDALMAAAAETMAQALRRGLAGHGRACIALSGGGTPEPAYAALARMALDWERVVFAQVDERFVPPEDEGSNQKMLRRALAPALAQGAHFAPLYWDTPDADACADAAEKRYCVLRFDLALMGMGADGHTASWFAGADGLAAALDPFTGRSVVAVRAQGAAGAAARLTLTRAALARTAAVTLLIAGADKRAALDAARAQAPEAAPAAALFQPPLASPRVLWAP